MSDFEYDAFTERIGLGFIHKSCALAEGAQTIKVSISGKRSSYILYIFMANVCRCSSSHMYAQDAQLHILVQEVKRF